MVLGVGVAAFFYQDGSLGNFGMASTGGTCEGEVTGGGMSGFSAAMLGALWAYDGWNNISYMAGEVKHPERNLPLALIASMIIIIVLYVLVNVSYYYVMTPTEVASVDASDIGCGGGDQKGAGAGGGNSDGRRDDAFVVGFASEFNPGNCANSLRDGSRWCFLSEPGSCLEETRRCR